MAGTFAGTPAVTIIVTDLRTRRLLIASAFAPSGLTRYTGRLLDTGCRIGGCTPDTADIPHAAGVIEADPADFRHDT